jgi:hypothetical protein
MSRSTVITPECVLSYPALFEPKPTPSGEERYSACLIFGADADLSALKAAAKAAAESGWGSKAAAMLKNRQLRWPFRDGAEKEGRAGYGSGTTFINVSSTRQPGVVSRYVGRDGKPLPIDDPAELYPGCRVRASLVAFAYDVSGNKGVSFVLCNVQKLGEGERLDGRLRAEDEFDAFEDAPVDLDVNGANDNRNDDDDGLSVTGRLQRSSQRVPRHRLRRNDENEPWNDNDDPMAA